MSAWGVGSAGGKAMLPVGMHESSAESLSAKNQDKQKYTTTSSSGPIELRGRVSNLTVIRLNSTCIEEIAGEVRKKTAQLPHFFQHVPVVIDVKSLSDDQIALVDFEALASTLKEMKLVPVAVGNLPTAFENAVTKAGLGLLKDGLGRPRPAPSMSKPSPARQAVTRPSPLGQLPTASACVPVGNRSSTAATSGAMMSMAANRSASHGRPAA